ncbi:sensor histidine kinase [Roseivirga sp. BDSF3-8]|uniref:sensor histidine kinase n=1 Tax=Roseivirga sp. BDSF3-8 TaxID=3241598 RepID=UPI00353277E3
MTKTRYIFLTVCISVFFLTESLAIDGLPSYYAQASAREKVIILMDLASDQAKNSPAEAVQSLDVAYSLADSLSDNRGMMRILELQAGLFDRLGQYEKSLEKLENVSVLRDSVAQETRRKQISRIYDSYESEKQSRDLEILKAQKEKNGQKLTQRNLFFFGLAAISCLIIVSLIALLSRYRITQNALKKISIQNDLLQEQFAELEILNRRLTESEEQFRYLNKQKAKFFGTISKDLKNPFSDLRVELNELMKAAGTMSEQELSNKALRINSNVDFLIVLIENLLFWSREQMDSTRLIPEKFSLSQLIHEVADQMRMQATYQGVSFKFDLDDTLVYADENTISFILKNIFTQTITYSESGTVLDISSVADDHTVELMFKAKSFQRYQEVQTLLEEAHEQEQLQKTFYEKSSNLGVIMSGWFLKRNRAFYQVYQEGDTTFFKFRFPIKEPDKKTLVHDN